MRAYYVDEIDNRGQFHQPFGAKLKYAGFHGFAPVAYPLKFVFFANEEFLRFSLIS